MFRGYRSGSGETLAQRSFPGDISSSAHTPNSWWGNPHCPINSSLINEEGRAQYPYGGEILNTRRYPGLHAAGPQWTLQPLPPDPACAAQTLHGSRGDPPSARCSEIIR